MRSREAGKHVTLLLKHWVLDPGKTGSCMIVFVVGLSY